MIPLHSPPNPSHCLPPIFLPTCPPPQHPLTLSSTPSRHQSRWIPPHLRANRHRYTPLPRDKPPGPRHRQRRCILRVALRC